MNIWNKTIQKLAVSKDKSNLRLVKSLIGGKQLLYWWFVSNKNYPQLNDLPILPYFHGELDKWGVWDWGEWDKIPRNGYGVVNSDALVKYLLSCK